MPGHHPRPDRHRPPAQRTLANSGERSRRSRATALPQGAPPSEAHTRPAITLRPGTRRYEARSLTLATGSQAPDAYLWRDAGEARWRPGRLSGHHSEAGVRNAQPPERCQVRSGFRTEATLQSASARTDRASAVAEALLLAACLGSTSRTASRSSRSSPWPPGSASPTASARCSACSLASGPTSNSQTQRPAANVDAFRRPADSSVRPSIAPARRRADEGSARAGPSAVRGPIAA